MEEFGTEYDVTTAQHSQSGVKLINIKTVAISDENNGQGATDDMLMDHIDQ